VQQLQQQQQQEEEEEKDGAAGSAVTGVDMTSWLSAADGQTKRRTTWRLPEEKHGVGVGAVAEEGEEAWVVHMAGTTPLMLTTDELH
jgi:hypothetical protein